MITTGIWRIVRNIFEATTGVPALTSFDPAEMVAGLASADEGGDHPDGPSGWMMRDGLQEALGSSSDYDYGMLWLQYSCFGVLD